MKIAIDGPAGAGKSTIAKLLARNLNITYLDTGAMYRALGLKSYENNVDIGDLDAVRQLLDSTTIDIVYNKGFQSVLLDGKDVSKDIRQNHISKVASDISAIKDVRMRMVELQRQLSLERDTVLDGRDIGTFVLPDAELKVYLTASIDERAKRRHQELLRRGIKCDFEKLKEEIAQRDHNDMNREFAPLCKAKDAVEVDTTHLTVDEVVQHLMQLVERVSK